MSLGKDGLWLVFFALILLNLGYAVINANQVSCTPPTNRYFVMVTGQAFFLLLMILAGLILLYFKAKSS